MSNLDKMRALLARSKRQDMRHSAAAMQRVIDIHNQGETT